MKLIIKTYIFANLKKITDSGTTKYLPILFSASNPKNGTISKTTY